MASCKGYEVDSCRLPPKSNSDYCSTCLLKKNKNTFLNFIHDIKSKAKEKEKSDEQILEMYESDDIQNMLSYCMRWNKGLDNFFSSLYYRSKPLLHHIIESFQKKSRLNIYLILRITDHSKTPMCDVYSYLLRKKVLNEHIYPNNCVHCLSNYITYAEDTFGIDRITKRTVLNDCKRMLKRELGNEKFFNRSYDIVRSLAESLHFPIDRKEIEIFIEELVKIAEKCVEYKEEDIQAFRKKVYHHPLLISQDLKAIKAFMKQKTAVWKIEWLAKALHPSRAPTWCYDSEDMEDCKNLGIIIEHVAIQKGKKAEWNISL